MAVGRGGLLEDDGDGVRFYDQDLYDQDFALSVFGGAVYREKCFGWRRYDRDHGCPEPRYQLWFPRRENLVGEELPAGGINDEATLDFSSFDIALELENADGIGGVMNRGEFLHYLEHLLPWSESREYWDAIRRWT